MTIHMKINLAIIVMAAVIVALLTVFISTNSSKILNSLFPGKEQIIEYGDDFSQVTYYDGSRKSSVSIIDTTYKLAYYLHADCSSCIEMLPLIDRLQCIFMDYNIEVILLWENEIPTKKLSKYNFNNYSLRNTQLDSVYGSLFLIDGDNIVIFKDNKQLDSLVLKLFELDVFDRTKLISNANTYIVDYYGDNNNSDKPMLVYFHMIGCPDCEAIDPIIDSGEILNKYGVVRISVEKNVAKSENDVYMDDMKLFKQVYSINWYPSFLLIDNDEYKVIGKISREDLLTELNDF